MAGTLTIHYGVPGTGKTLFAMEDIIIPCVREGRPFFTNITGISLSGLSAVTGVHQSMIKFYPIETITDVIKYYDDTAISHNGVFVLDEMKDFVDNDKAISWLESCINLMRKNAIDFVLIAQLPDKKYIADPLRELATNCNVFRRRYSLGDKSHTEMYQVNGGTPRIVNQVPVNSVNMKVRRIDPVVFSCYKTSENEFYTGKENDSYKGAMWWQTTKWKARFIGMAVVAFMFGLGFFLIHSITGMTPKTQKQDISKNGAIKNEQSKIESTQKIQEDKAEKTGEPCFTYIVCDSTLCETDIGIIPPDSYNDVYNVVRFNGNNIHKCKGNKEFPDGGGLLRTGSKVSGAS